VISYREIRLSLDPFSVVVPKEAPGHKLASQHDDDDHGQHELDDTPEPDLDFGVRVWLFWSDVLPSNEPLVSLAFTCEVFLVFLLLLVAILLVPVITSFGSPILEADGWMDRKRRPLGP
jgi:hypothetical protein